MSIQDHIASQMREETDMSLSEARNGRSRILARQLARPLTAEEIDVVSGATAAVGYAVAGPNFGVAPARRDVLRARLTTEGRPVLGVPGCPPPLLTRRTRTRRRTLGQWRPPGTDPHYGPTNIGACNAVLSRLPPQSHHAVRWALTSLAPSIPFCTLRTSQPLARLVASRLDAFDASFAADPFITTAPTHVWSAYVEAMRPPACGGRLYRAARNAITTSLHFAVAWRPSLLVNDIRRASRRAEGAALIRKPCVLAIPAPVQQRS